MGFSQEGKSFWVLKSAPISVPRLLSAKFLVAYLPTLVLVWVFLIIMSIVQRADLSSLIFGLAVIFLVLAGAAGVNLAFGVLGAKFNWEDPRRINQGGVGCLGALASMIFFVVSLVLFFGPSLLLKFIGGSQVAGQWIGLALGGVVSLACAFIPLWLVRKRVPRLGEE
jgi:ABC-2 type transport system permease protein